MRAEGQGHLARQVHQLRNLAEHSQMGLVAGDASSQESKPANLHKPPEDATAQHMGGTKDPAQLVQVCQPLPQSLPLNGWGRWLGELLCRQGNWSRTSYTQHLCLAASSVPGPLLGPAGRNLCRWKGDLTPKALVFYYFFKIDLPSAASFLQIATVGQG